MKKNKKYRTKFLFVTPSFTMGMGSVLNIAGNYFPFNNSDSDIEIDIKGIESDWLAIGQDLKTAIKETNRNLQNSRKVTNG